VREHAPTSGDFALCHLFRFICVNCLFRISWPTRVYLTVKRLPYKLPALQLNINGNVLSWYLVELNIRDVFSIASMTRLPWTQEFRGPTRAHCLLPSLSPPSLGGLTVLCYVGTYLAHIQYIDHSPDSQACLAIYAQRS